MTFAFHSLIIEPVCVLRPERGAMIRRLCTCLISAVIVLLPSSALADDDSDYPPDSIMFDWNVRSIYAMGFYPFGGNATVQSAQVATYIIGPGLDFFTFNENSSDIYGRRRRKQFTVLNISGYLVGFDWAALSNPEQQNKTTKFINLGYFRAGPHFAFNTTGFRGGFQIGYGAVLLSEDEKDNVLKQSKFLHGIDLCGTITY